MTVPSCLVFAGFFARHFTFDGITGLLVLDMLRGWLILGFLGVTHGAAKPFDGTAQIASQSAEALGAEQQQDNQQNNQQLPNANTHLISPLSHYAGRRAITLKAHNRIFPPFYTDARHTPL
jgi:hypothetical protein